MNRYTAQVHLIDNEGIATTFCWSLGGPQESETLCDLITEHLGVPPDSILLDLKTVRKECEVINNRSIQLTVD